MLGPEMESSPASPPQYVNPLQLMLVPRPIPSLLSSSIVTQSESPSNMDVSSHQLTKDQPRSPHPEAHSHIPEEDLSHNAEGSNSNSEGTAQDDSTTSEKMAEPTVNATSDSKKDDTAQARNQPQEISPNDKTSTSDESMTSVDLQPINSTTGGDQTSVVSATTDRLVEDNSDDEITVLFSAPVRPPKRRKTVYQQGPSPGMIYGGLMPNETHQMMTVSAGAPTNLARMPFIPGQSSGMTPAMAACQIDNNLAPERSPRSQSLARAPENIQISRTGMLVGSGKVDTGIHGNTAVPDVGTPAWNPTRPNIQDSGPVGSFSDAATVMKNASANCTTYEGRPGLTDGALRNGKRPFTDSHHQGPNQQSFPSQRQNNITLAPMALQSSTITSDSYSVSPRYQRNTHGAPDEASSPIHRHTLNSSQNRGFLGHQSSPNILNGRKNHSAGAVPPQQFSMPQLMIAASSVPASQNQAVLNPPGTRVTANHQQPPTPSPTVDNRQRALGPSNAVPRSLYEIPEWPGTPSSAQNAPSQAPHQSAAIAHMSAYQTPSTQTGLMLPPPRPQQNKSSSSAADRANLDQFQRSMTANLTQHPKDIFLDIAETSQANFPFSLVAQRHHLPVQKVYDAFSAIIQLPLLRAKGRLGAQKMKEFRAVKREVKGLHAEERKNGGWDSTTAKNMGM